MFAEGVLRDEDSMKSLLSSWNRELTVESLKCELEAAYEQCLAFNRNLMLLSVTCCCVHYLRPEHV